MKTAKLFTLALGVLLAVSGCSNVKTATDKDGGTYSKDSSNVSVSGVEGSSNFSGTDTMSQEDLMKQLTFYFNFDRSDIRSDAFPSLEAHANYLANHPNAHVRVEGHCDERGSREYNVALGERRALAVSRVLMLGGADKSQISVVSYGEEKPAVRGHDEAAYSKNRRAVLVYEAE